MDSRTGVEIKVVDWEDGRREVAIHFRDLDTMITLDAKGARRFASLLVQCARYIDSFIAGNEELDPESDQESISLFGPYEDEDDDEDE